MTNLDPNGERYLIPISLKTTIGTPRLHRYTFPFCGEYVTGSVGANANLVIMPGVPTGGGSRARTGARLLQAQEAALPYSKELDTSVGKCPAKAIITKSTVSGSSENKHKQFSNGTMIYRETTQFFSYSFRLTISAVDNGCTTTLVEV